jgi:hypothetical protein
MVSENDRKTTAQVEVIDSAGAAVGRFKSFEVHFPKPNGRSSSMAYAPHPVSPRAVSPPPIKRASDAPQGESRDRTEASTSALNSPLSIPATKIVDTQGSSKALSLASRVQAPTNVQESDGPGWIGIAMRDDAKGVVITRVVERSSAAEAGLQVGDIIDELNSTPVRSAMRFDVAITRSKPGSQIRISYIREGSKREVTLSVARLGALN